MKTVERYKQYIIREYTERDGLPERIGVYAVYTKDGEPEYDDVETIPMAKELIDGLWKDRVTGTYGLTNTACLKTYEFIYDIDDKILVGLNDEIPKAHKIYYAEDGHYIKWGKQKILLNEIMRV